MASQPVSLLVLSSAARADRLQPLLSGLGARLAVETSTDPAQLRQLEPTTVLYVDSCDRELDEGEAAALLRFVQRGGGAVVAGDTLHTWRESAPVTDLAGFVPDGRTVHAELLLRDAAEATLLGDRLPVHGTVHLLPHAPPGATSLVETTWQHENQVVAYSRPYGAGRFTFLGLQHDGDAYHDARVRSLIRSAVLHAAASAGASRMFGVGLLGFGALGSAHGAAIAETDGLSLRCVCDISAGRREAAELHGVDTVADADALYQRDDVDVVLIGTPPVHHAAAALAALDAGKHVVCEKPFALTAADCDAVIDRAKAVDRVVTVFQNRRWDPDFVAVRDVVRSGAVGTLFEMESFVGGFGHPCHYWHSHEPISGGALFDWGSHYIDWMLQLFDAEVVRVACTAHKRVWHDVTNADHITVQLRFGDGATASFTHSHLAAAAKPKWYLLGTRGAVVADWDHAVRHVAGPDGELDEQPVAVTDLPARVRVLRPGPDGRSSEEALALPRRDRGAFYRNLAAHLRDGEPLAVPAQQARRTVAVLETATASAREGGRLIDTSI